MDRIIEKKKWPPKTILGVAGACAVTMALAFLVFDSPRTSTILIDPSRISVTRVQQGDFLEFIPIIGTVEPIKTVYLDAVEGGRVDEILAEDGKPVKAGDMIIRLSNAALQKESISTESRLLENINTLRNTRIDLAEKELILKEELLNTSYRVQQLEKKHRRFKKLISEGNSALSQSEFELVADELVYQRNKREIIEARIVQEKTLREQQLEQVDATIERVERNLSIIEETVDSLDIRAPISGHLSTLKVEIGQSVSKGNNIGQIDVLDEFKVRAQVDQYYIAKVALGQIGDFEFDAESYDVEVRKIYPEVSNDMFEVDLAFLDEVPTGIKRGQSLRINLSLSGASKSLLVKRGGFYRSTGGRWIYQVATNGRHAYRQDIQIGRQNPSFFELLGGLNEGEQVITSSYDSFGSAEKIEFTQPLGEESL